MRNWPKIEKELANKLETFAEKEGEAIISSRKAQMEMDMKQHLNSFTRIFFPFLRDI